MKKRSDSIPGYLPALDGIRAVSLILIWVFHIWQQSWIGYNIKAPDGRIIYSFDLFQRCGYIAVDAFFVLSGFCLFYPIARSMFGECKEINWKDFYIKRAKKILPSYVFMLLFILIIPDLGYIISYNLKDGLRQFLTALTFTSTSNTMTHGALISTSWTLCIEVQFYLLFPIIAYLFKKKPVISFFAISILTELARIWAVTNVQLNTVAQGVALFYLDIFAFGMIAAYAVVWARNKLEHIDKLKIPMTLIAVVCLYMIYKYMGWMVSANIPDMDSATVHRFIYRPILNFPIALFIFASCFSFNFWQKGILGNRLAVFLSTISYNFYLWHQNIHIYFRRHPVTSLFTVNDIANHTHEPMVKFTLFTLCVSLVISIAVTYLLEKPMYKYGFVGYFKNIYNKLSGKGKKHPKAIKG